MQFYFIHALLCDADHHTLVEHLDTLHTLTNAGQTVHLVLLCQTLPPLPENQSVFHCPIDAQAFYSPQMAADHLSTVLPPADDQTWYLFAANHFGSTLCTLFSAKQSLPCMQQVKQLHVTPDGVEFQHDTHAGKVEMHFRSPSAACFSLISAGSRPAPFVPGAPTVTLLSPCPKRTDVQTYTPSMQTIDLSSAPRVWIGGRGMQSAEQFTVFRQFAQSVGALTACTRPAGMNGWHPLDALVGISGVSLSADCCLVVGVSGSSAFLSGIRNCGTIIAINSNPDAEIFRFCDYKLVCSSAELLQALERHISHK